MFILFYLTFIELFLVWRRERTEGRRERTEGDMVRMQTDTHSSIILYVHKHTHAIDHNHCWVYIYSLTLTHTHLPWSKPSSGTLKRTLRLAGRLCLSGAEKGATHTSSTHTLLLFSMDTRPGTGVIWRSAGHGQKVRARSTD